MATMPPHWVNDREGCHIQPRVGLASHAPHPSQLQGLWVGPTSKYFLVTLQRVGAKWIFFLSCWDRKPPTVVDLCNFIV